MREARDAVEGFKNREPESGAEEKDAEENSNLDDLDKRLRSFGEVAAVDSGKSLQPVMRSGMGRSVGQAVALMQQTAASPHRIWMSLVKGYREVDPVSWPFPKGCKERLAVLFPEAEPIVHGN